MAPRRVWIHPTVSDLFQQLLPKLGGHPPILSVFGTEEPISLAGLHQPTLYPELSVPENVDGDWGEVARGIAHLLSSLDGVPELRVFGTEVDHGIARDLNSELQIIAAVKENLQPKPRWKKNLDALVASLLRPRSLRRSPRGSPGLSVLEDVTNCHRVRTTSPETRHAHTRRSGRLVGTATSMKAG
jgi:hypothetical protein